MKYFFNFLRFVLNVAGNIELILLFLFLAALLIGSLALFAANLFKA